MAISISEQYPGKTAGNTTAYPYGEPRNVDAPGDGKGTPWEAAIVKDDQGFKQAILKAANVVPSGQPDTADESQYLDALKSIFPSMGAFTATLGTTGELAIPVIVGTTPRKIIIKWGTVDYDTRPMEGDRTVTFSRAFPTACFNIVLTRKVVPGGDQNSNDGGIHLAGTPTRSDFIVNLAQFNDKTWALRGFTWLAIGY